MARTQTSGRGSRGRGWTSPPGNLYLSLMLRPLTEPRDAGKWALLAGVAAAEALSDFDVMLKWPNDILYDGAKLGGILVETSLDVNGRLDFLVIGIGINLAHAPNLPERRTVSLDGAIEPRPVAQTILNRVAHWQTQEWKSVRSAWLRHALPIGAAMSLRQGDVYRSGRFAGLNEDGSLLLDEGGSVRVVSSGEIWLASESLEETP